MSIFFTNRVSVRNTGVGFNELKELFTDPEITSGGIFHAIKKMPEHFQLNVMTTFLDSMGEDAEPSLAFLLKEKSSSNIQDGIEWRSISWGTLNDIFEVREIYSSADEFVFEFETDFYLPYPIYLQIFKKFRALTFVIAGWSFEHGYAQCLACSPNICGLQGNSGDFLKGADLSLYEPLELPEEVKEIAHQFKDPFPYGVFKYGRFSE